MTTNTLCPRLGVSLGPTQRRHRVSLVARTLARNGTDAIHRGAMTHVRLDSPSRIIQANGGEVWCRNYRALAGLFRKDRGPSKEFGRALCDEVKERFGCDGFFTTDELPRYGITRGVRREIERAVDAGSDDCVVIFAYDAALAREIDAYLIDRLRAMA